MLNSGKLVVVRVLERHGAQGSMLNSDKQVVILFCIPDIALPHGRACAPWVNYVVMNSGKQVIPDRRV